MQTVVTKAACGPGFGIPTWQCTGPAQDQECTALRVKEKRLTEYRPDTPATQPEKGREKKTRMIFFYRICPRNSLSRSAGAATGEVRALPQMRSSTFFFVFFLVLSSTNMYIAPGRQESGDEASRSPVREAAGPHQALPAVLMRLRRDIVAVVLACDRELEQELAYAHCAATAHSAAAHRETQADRATGRSQAGLATAHCRAKRRRNGKLRAVPQGQAIHDNLEALVINHPHID